MKALSSSEMLEIWDMGRVQSPVERALILMAAAYPGESMDSLAALSIGQRDSCLLTLREMIFGQDMDCLIACPSCGDSLELDFKVEDIRKELVSKKNEVLSLGASGYDVQFRLPNSEDLIAISDGSEMDEMRHRLLWRCIMSALWNGEVVPANDLPAGLLDAVVSEMAQADPQADVRLELLCPSCGVKWRAVFDVVSFLWSEIDALARRTLREVHILASAYGWTEADILELSPWRRQCYKDMVED